jgi:hypothetical protein
VILRDHQLKYYKHGPLKKYDEMAGCLNFDLYACSVTKGEKDNILLIHITGSDR